MYFAEFHGFLCTCNVDGSIPLNAKVVCRVDEINPALMDQLLRQANANNKTAVGFRELDKTT